MQRVFFDVDATVLGAADEDDLVSDGGTGDVSHVDRDQIHRDVADDRCVLVAQDNPAFVREVATEAIPIPDWNNGDAGWARRLIVPSISDSLSDFKILQRDNARLPREHRSQR